MTSSGHVTGAYLTQQKPFLLINEKFCYHSTLCRHIWNPSFLISKAKSKLLIEKFMHASKPLVRLYHFQITSNKEF